MHNYGEPFVDRQPVEKVRYEAEGRAAVGMISNGSPSLKRPRGMIEAGPTINISVTHRARKSSSARAGLSDDKVIANVERLLARCRGRGGPS